MPLYTELWQLIDYFFQITSYQLQVTSYAVSETVSRPTLMSFLLDLWFVVEDDKQESNNCHEPRYPKGNQISSFPANHFPSSLIPIAIMLAKDIKIQTIPIPAPKADLENLPATTGPTTEVVKTTNASFEKTST